MFSAITPNYIDAQAFNGLRNVSCLCRSVATTVYGVGLFVILNIPNRSGRCWPGGFVNSKCCIIVAKNRKSSIFASDSPIHARLPGTNKQLVINAMQHKASPWRHTFWGKVQVSGEYSCRSIHTPNQLLFPKWISYIWGQFTTPFN